jgi:hypothetical protein
MRAYSVIVLLAISFSILSPLSVHLTITHGLTSIGTFDVCHAGSLALSTGNDTLCVGQPLYHPWLPSHVEYAEMLNPKLKLITATFKDEHPPKT